jgi:6-phosphogluconolactonase
MHSRNTHLITSVIAAGVVVLSLGIAGRSQTPSGDKAGMLVYFGTYTNEKSKGIYVSRLDLAKGVVSPPELVAESRNPSFLAVHPSGDFLYSVGEISDFGGKPGGTGSVSAFAVQRATGMLKPLNQQSSGGAGPAHLITDKAGTNVLVANYGGGSVAVLPIDKDGSLKAASAFVQHTGSSVNPDRQKGPHAHSVNLDPGNRFAYVADLGLDKVMIYRFKAADGSLVANDPPSAAVEPGAGPRHFAFHPQGHFAYVINEMQCTITAFSADAASGALKAVQTISTLPAGRTVEKGFSTAEVQVHPSGRFLYGSNRGHDSIAVYSIDEKTGRLTLIQHEATQGSTPRGFGIDPTGNFLLAGNQRSDTVVVFRIDTKTGGLTPTGQTIPLGAPVCVKFVTGR